MSWFSEWAKGSDTKGGILFSLLIALLPKKTRNDLLKTLVNIRANIASGKTQAALEALDKLIAGLGGG